MLYGIITHVQSGLGIVYSDDKKYKFSLMDFPSAETGMEVIFDPTNISQSHDEIWITGIQPVRMSPFASILKRIEKIENDLLKIKNAYELPESFFAKYAGATDESA